MQLYQTKEVAANILYMHILDSHNAVSGTCYFDRKVAETILLEAILVAHQKKAQPLVIEDIAHSINEIPFLHENVRAIAAKIQYILSRAHPQAPIEGYELYREELQAYFSRKGQGKSIHD